MVERTKALGLDGSSKEIMRLGFGVGGWRYEFIKSSKIIDEV